MLQNEIIFNEPIIRKELLNEINDMLNKLYSLSPRIQEPDYVAMLVMDFTKSLADVLNRRIASSTFTTTGIFCHQSPIVVIPKPYKSPEVGDLLFVYITKDIKGNKIYNSLLLQAKVTNSDVFMVTRAEEHQYILYSEWPKFEYKYGALKGKSIDVLPKNLHSGAQYLLIDKRRIYNRYPYFKFCTAMSNNPITINSEFTDEIINFLKLISGRQFLEDSLKSKDAWSEFIWDMITLTKTKKFNRKNIGLRNKNRQYIYNMPLYNSKDFWCHSNGNSELFNHDLVDKYENYDYDDNSGLSMIIIEEFENANENVED